MNAYKPRIYQEGCLEALAEARNQGKNKALVVMASGLGKTLTGAFDVREYLKTNVNGRVLVLCHSAAILTQTKETFKEIFGDSFSYGMYNGQEKATHRTDFLFANLQSINLHSDEFEPDEFSYIIVDEAHHSPAKTYRKAIEHFSPQFLLGMTATPERMDDADLTEIFGKAVFEYRLESAIKDGWLSEVEYRVKTDEIQNLETILDSGKKFSLAQLNREVFAPKRDEEIIRIIREEISEKDNPTMVIFCQTIAHAEKFAELMGDAVVIHSGLDNDEITERLEGFRSGSIKTVCAVDMLNEGIDVPRTDVIVFLRVTQSQIVFTQQLGRGLRRADGKDKVLVLDFVSTADHLDMLFQFEREFKDSIGQYPNRKSSGERKYFTLNIDAPVFRDRKVDIIALIERARNAYSKQSLQHTYSDTELIQLLVDFANTIGHFPTQTEVDNAKGLVPASTTYVKRFGPWEIVMEIADMKSARKYYTDEMLINLLRSFVERLGHLPTYDEINNDPYMPCSETYTSHFGTMEIAFSKIGEKYVSKKQYFSDQEIWEPLVDFVRSTGRAPATTELGKNGLPNYGLIVRRLGPWSDIMHKLGVKLVGRNAGYSDDELLRLLRKKAKENDGFAPSRREIDKDPSMPSVTTYKAHFGPSWDKVLAAAGLKKRSKSKASE